ncbi:unnamed protein product [Dracunculus medinensis]|uniref:Transposase n=1 Tax=Dracunculus medinensis TaxID=318479 RepID=A0A0N4U2Z7_DRAME|nr:unnamed protein product [Dracunculus medinensis]
MLDRPLGSIRVQQRKRYVQVGFRKSRGIRDIIDGVRLIIEKAKEYQTRKSLYDGSSIAGKPLIANCR